MESVAASALSVAFVNYNFILISHTILNRLPWNIRNTKYAFLSLIPMYKVQYVLTFIRCRFYSPVTGSLTTFYDLF